MLFSICKCLNMDKMATAQRESHRHRSELKHLFISRAPPLNQTEPDPGHWPPDWDYNVVRVRTAGPSRTLLGVLLTTPFIQPYRLELTQTATSVTTLLKMCWFAQFEWSCVLYSCQHCVMKQSRFFTTFFFFQQCRKLREASGKPAVLNLKKKKELFMQLKWGEDMQLLCAHLHFNW